MTGKEEGHLLEFEDKSTIIMEAQGWDAKQRWEGL
jgi:hypothetical protein